MNAAVDAPVLLSIRGLHKSFGGLKVTDDVSMDLRAGLITTLVGPNGAGKTTLFNQITGHLAPDAGDILWKGRSLLGQSHYAIARMGVARTFQDLRLFDQMTVLDNVLTVMEPSAWVWQRGGRAAARARRDKAAQILEKTGLAGSAMGRTLSFTCSVMRSISSRAFSELKRPGRP